MVPARRVSKSRKRLRRSHHALKPRNLVACPRCSSAKLPHRACEKCGYVNQKVAVKIATEE
ncbi:MAG: 50S ribosomal protein L32 [Phycisphaerae bacterium]|nr:50S ribosomal protein L32 [Phycisphaerae bacterium]